MRKSHIALSIVSILCLVSHLDAADDKRYSIKSGIIEYTITGNQEGTEKVYFDKFGLKEARYTDATLSVFGFSKAINQIYLMDGEWSYSYDANTNIATKMNAGQMAQEMRKNSKAKNLRDFGEAMMKELGGKIVGKKKILGKTCNIWDIPSLGTIACIYKKSVPLETEVSMAGIQINMIATMFKENVKIPQDKLKLPDNAQIQEMASLENFQRTINNSDKKEMPKLDDIIKLFGNTPKDAPAIGNDNQPQADELEMKQKELQLKKMEMEMEQLKKDSQAE